MRDIAEGYWEATEEELAAFRRRLGREPDDAMTVDGGATKAEGSPLAGVAP